MGSKKKQSVNSQKKTIKVIRDGFFLILFGGIVLFSLIEGIQSYKAEKGIRTNDFEVYQGRYELVENKTVRNTVHVLKLENGEKTTVPYTDDNEFFYGDNSKFKDFSELKVCYSKQKFFGWGGNSACISIESADGKVLILDSEIVREELMGRAILFLCIGGICLLLLLGLIFIRFYPFFEKIMKTIKKKAQNKGKEC